MLSLQHMQYCDCRVQNKELSGLSSELPLKVHSSNAQKGT